MNSDSISSMAEDGLTESIAASGFAIIPSVLDREQARNLAGSLAEGDLLRSRAGIRHVLRHPTVATLAKDRCLVGLARQVLGSSALPYRATLFDKSPESNWLVVWHQDTALPLCERREVAGWGPWSVKDGVLYAHAPAKALTQVLALRIHLDDSTADNGPLKVLRGSHLSGVLTDDAIERLAEETTPAECLVKSGGVLAMRPLLVHASSKSHADKPRRVLHIEYAARRHFEGGLELAQT